MLETICYLAFTLSHARRNVRQCIWISGAEFLFRFDTVLPVPLPLPSPLPLPAAANAVKISRVHRWCDGYRPPPAQRIHSWVVTNSWDKMTLLPLSITFFFVFSLDSCILPHIDFKCEFLFSAAISLSGARIETFVQKPFHVHISGAATLLLPWTSSLFFFRFLIYGTRYFQAQMSSDDKSPTGRTHFNSHLTNPKTILINFLRQTFANWLNKIDDAIVVN